MIKQREIKSRLRTRKIRNTQFNTRNVFFNLNETAGVLAYEPLEQVLKCEISSSKDDLPYCLAEPPSVEEDQQVESEIWKLIKENELGMSEIDNRMRTRVINFVAAPSVGKTTMSALIFAELKHMHKTAELVQEYAKTLVWQERFEELDNQYQVSMEQYKMLKAVDGKVEYAVMDSPLIVGLFYNRTYETNVCNVEKTEAMILSKMAEFENIYIYLERNEEFPYEKQGRVHNEEQSRQIEKQMVEMLEELKIQYIKVKSSKKSIPIIMEYIKSTLKKS
jgi:nicotinamide riboside kinase